MQALLLFALSLLPQVAPSPTPVASAIKTVPVPVLQRVVVVGASLSDGFGLDLDSGARTSFSEVVEAGLKAEHERVASHSSSLLFQDAPKYGRKEIEAARALEPTLVVAVDYLFWFGYGLAPSEEERSARFDQGLQLLEGFTCPVLVGNLPDMHAALKGESHITRGPLLIAAQVPSPAILKKLNERLAEWNTAHKNVIVVPLAMLVERLQSGLEIELRGNTWPSGSFDKMFQKDLLHPTLLGSSAVLLFSIDALLRAQPNVPASAFEWDANAIVKRVYDAKAPEREAKLEKQRKAKEREKEREKKKSETPDPKSPSPQ